jgi:HTH-type transcriptional regulator/antitoxin HigA
MMKPKVLKTEAEYEAALQRVDRLMDASIGTARAEELELWTWLVERYEEEHHPFDPPDPIEAILFRMEQQGLKQVDLIPFIGSKSKVSEVLNRKRPLSLGMVRSLSEGLGIPAEVLIQEKRPTLDNRPRSVARDRYPFRDFADRS